MANASLISDVTGDLRITGGSFTMNVRQTTIRKGLARRDFNNLCSNLHSANAKRNADLGHIVESRMQKFSKNLEDHQNAVFSVVRRLQPPFTIDGMQQGTAHALLSRAQQVVELLPVAHRDLARQFAGAVRFHNETQSFGDNLVLVGGPLLSSSIFSTFSAEVQFMVFYFLAAMIFVDLFHPRLTYNKPSSRVSVLDALGKYHDFPWSACENLMTFHTEFLRRFLNQTGYPFVKSRSYEVEHNGCIMESDDWATIKPFTDLFVNFVLIQQGGRSQVVRCPWCRRENPLPFVSGSEECSCSECGRHFSAAVGSSAKDGGDQHTLSRGMDKTISTEIRRFRIRLQLPPNRLSTIHENVSTTYGSAQAMPTPQQVPQNSFLLQPSAKYLYGPPENKLSNGSQSSIEIDINPPSRPPSSIDQEIDGSAFLSPNNRPVPLPSSQETPLPIRPRTGPDPSGNLTMPSAYDYEQPNSPVIPGVTVPMPQPPSRGNPGRNVPTPVIDGPLPPGFVPQTITDSRGVSTPIWQGNGLPPPVPGVNGSHQALPTTQAPRSAPIYGNSLNKDREIDEDSYVPAYGSSNRIVGMTPVLSPLNLPGPSIAADTNMGPRSGIPIYAPPNTPSAGSNTWDYSAGRVIPGPLPHSPPGFDEEEDEIDDIDLLNTRIAHWFSEVEL